MDQRQILDNLSTHLKNAVARAISIAASMKHAKVTLTHILLALSEEQGSIAADILTKSKINKQYLLYLLSQEPQANLPRQKTAVLTAMVPELNNFSKQALERAMLIAYEREHNYVGTEHLLLGIIESKDQDVFAILRNAKITPEEMINQLESTLASTSQFPDIDEISDTLEQIQSMAENQAPLPAMNQTADNSSAKPSKQNKQAKRLPTAREIFTIELTDKNRQKDIDPVIGREIEIERAVNILCRRTKNNPVLVGEAGVGKTAMVEGLAKKICEGKVPDMLKRKRIFSLDLTLMVSGTIYRGEFEARLKQLIDEFSSEPNFILFIDELHNIIGAGSNSGTMDAANILKPALARGKLHCIGATTIDEYKKYIAGDPALERRFQAISVNEPSMEETTAILHGVKTYYEDFHNTTITNEAIEAAVELSTKYIHDYFLPDKAIDLIDEASSSVRVRQKASPSVRQLYDLEDQLQNCLEQKESAILAEQFEQALAYKDQAEELAQKIEKAKNNLNNHQKNQTKRERVIKKDVAKVLGAKIQIDPEILLADEWEKLQTLPDRIKKQLVGQDEIIDRITQALRQAQLGINSGKRPFTSLFFIGPSGVGKTELAKILAKELYFDDRALVKLDMSEFSEAHGVSKLLGSPAGYVGYKERNKFLDTVRTRPYSVVLFDEFDKAHPDVRKLLFQILDEGELTDSTGKKISFRHAIIILTSNVGAELFKSSGIGFGSNQKNPSVNQQKELTETMLYKLKEEFGNALIGRMKKICVFQPLTAEHMEQIIKNFINKLSLQLTTAKKLSVVPDAGALKSLATETYDADMGARNMEHVVENILHELIIPKLQLPKLKKNYKLTKVRQEYKLV